MAGPGDFYNQPTPTATVEPEPSSSPLPPSAFFSDVKHTQKQVGKAVDKTIGNPIVEGIKHPLELMTNVLGTGQRALEAVEVGKNPWEAATHPKEQQQLFDEVKDKYGIRKFQDTVLKGDDPLHKFARGAVDTGLSVINDPINVAGPVLKGLEALGATGKVAGAAGKLVPGAVKDVLSPTAEIAHLTPDQQKVVQSLYNQKRYNTEKEIKAAVPVIAANAKTIRAGQIPNAVAALFHDPKNVPPAGPNMDPREVLESLKSDLGAKHHENYINDLQANNVHDVATENLGQQSEGQGVVLKAMKKMRDLSNKAFFTIPAAHPLNLTDFAYNRYGPAVTLEGLRRTAELMSGKVSPTTARSVAALEQAGGAHIYSNVYSGLAKNALLQMGQKASNKAQDVILNNAEMGLRSAAYDALIKKGAKPEEAAVDVSKAFGTDLPNKLTKGFNEVGAQFAQFHGQSVVGSGLKTLGTHPERIANAIKVQQGINRTPSGEKPGDKSPKYMFGVPGMSINRAAGDPFQYFAPLLGPLGALEGTYSAYTDAEKGKISAAVSQLAGQYVPAADTISALYATILGNKGRAGEPGVNDLITSLTGGWYTKHE